MGVRAAATSQLPLLSAGVLCPHPMTPEKTYEAYVPTQKVKIA